MATSPKGRVITLKRLHEDSNPATVGSIASSCSGHKPQCHTDCSSDDELNLVKALRRRDWIHYYESESCSDDSDLELVHPSPKASSLPAGVLRGCPSCDSCQKVLARWQPEAGCRPSLHEAPVFFPLEEEFQDTLQYIASISAEAEQYGICRIVPPQSWRPPCPLRDFNNRHTTQLPTRVQQVHKLQVRGPQNKSHSQGKKRRRGRQTHMFGPAGRDNPGSRCQSSAEDNFGFDAGPDFTLDTFEKYANQFKEEYFGISDAMENPELLSLSSDCKKRWEPSVENIEGEYWRIVEQATEEIEVIYGADIETGDFGSGFPKPKPGMEPILYESSGWNLNNIARLPGSVLSFEEADISGVLVPWLYVGMCFSSFCWHVEDHHFYSLNYMHWGAPKVWYGVPSNAASKLEDTMKRQLPDLFEEQPDLLHKLVTQLSPSILKTEGVPVYRAVQRPGEFVVTFPRAYHAGFNCGFNCAEAVNVAPLDWLPHGQLAVELYREQRRKTSVSHDKLLLGAAKQALRILQRMKEKKNKETTSAWQDLCDKNGILARTFKERVEMEQRRRAGLSTLVHSKRMDSSFDRINEKECFVCHYDLHFSAIGCECSPEQFACLEHAQLLCACSQQKKFMLYRYSLSELHLILTALEGHSCSSNNLVTLEKLPSVEQPTVSPKDYLDANCSFFPRTFEDVKNERPEVGVQCDHLSSLSQPSIDISEFKFREDVLRFGIVNATSLLNQQLNDKQRPYLLSSRSCFQSQQSLSNFNHLGGVVGLSHLQQNEVFESDLSRTAFSGRLGEKILPRKRSKGSTSELVLSSGCLKPSNLQPFYSPAQQLSQEDMYDRQNTASQGLCITSRVDLCSNPISSYAWDASVKMGNEVIVLSDDEEDVAGPLLAPGCGHDRSSYGAVADKLSECWDTRHGVSRTLRFLDPSNLYEGQCRNISEDDIGQVNLASNLYALEAYPAYPLESGRNHMITAGNVQELYKNPYQSSVTQPAKHSFAPGKHTKSQEIWNKSTDCRVLPLFNKAL